MIQPHTLSFTDETKEDAYFEALLARVPEPRSVKSKPVNITIRLAARPFPPFYAPGTAPLSLGISITPNRKVRLQASIAPGRTPSIIEVKLPKRNEPGEVFCREGDVVGILLQKSTRSNAASEGKAQRGLKACLLVNGAAVVFRGAGAPVDVFDFLPCLGSGAYAQFAQAVFKPKPCVLPGSLVAERNLIFETPGLHAAVSADRSCELLVTLNTQVPCGVPGYPDTPPIPEAEDAFGLGYFGLIPERLDRLLHVPAYAAFSSGPPSYCSQAPPAYSL
jgi:hypothetical protein